VAIKRVHQVAKELGVDGKAIVAKCHAEGISADLIKNHMSTVSAGLEATIREWFSGGGTVATAVETADRVDLEAVRVRPARARAKPRPGPPALESEPAPSEPETAPPAPEAEAAPPDPAAPPPVPEPELKKPEPPRSAAPDPTPAPPAPPAPPPPHPQRAPTRDAPASAAKMNVPRRPTVVGPAGPRLEVQAPVRLSGPKVVRVEAPEPVREPRRPRPEGVGPPGPPTGPARAGRGGMGVMPAGPAGAEERGGRGSRSAANKRRSSGSGVPEKRRGRAAEWTPTTWSDQDLAEREARLARAGGFLKQHRQRLRRQQDGAERSAAPAQVGGRVTIAAPFSIKDLSATTGVKAADIVKKLFLQGVMAGINSGIDPEHAQAIMLDFNIELDVIAARSAEREVLQQSRERADVDRHPRGPVVTILGHVDHGKTSLLDRIRDTNVAAGEAGGITQKTSAFRVPVRVGDEERQIVFIDTPGHEAFTAMRARGASVTDIVVLVVAADDGVMPQTIESINHARAAGVPIVVALNKIDRSEATEPNVQKILGQLAEHGLNPVAWGGQTEVVRTSATKGIGITELLEALDYQAQLLELTADFGGPATGTVIEARTEPGRGPVASLLLQQGELCIGDFIVAGRAFGRVRDITDDRGERLRRANPPMPVQVSGLDEIPDAGDKFYVVGSLKQAQDAAEQRRAREREAQLAQPKVTLDTLFSQMAESELKEILIVLKADVQGSVDVLRSEVEKVSTDEIKVRVLHAAVGGITESDVLLADASRAIIVGFNVIPSGKARQLADAKGVEIRTYDVIYHITEDIRKAAEGLLEPELRQEVLGHAEVRRVFRISRVGAVAGCYVTDGTVQRDALIRVTRGDIVIEKDRRLEQLRRFKEDVKDVRAGMECGMKIVGYDDIKEGDILECYRNVEVRRTL
jgi:translation initiation factor IF-2